MRKALGRHARLALVCLAPVLAAAGGTVEGRVTLAGPLPKAAADMDSTGEPVCATQHLREEAVLLGGKDGRGLANVLLRVNGPRPVTPPTTPVKVEQQACAYRPRVQGAVVGQPLWVLNSDATLHNVHAYAGAKGLFNVAQPPGAPAVTRPSPSGPGAVQLRCDIHRWMVAWVVYGESPTFAVSDSAGDFRLDSVPAGSWQLEAWHESFGTRTIPVVVKEGARLRVALAYRAP